MSTENAAELGELGPETLVDRIKEKKAEMEQVLAVKEKSLEDAPEGNLRINKKDIYFQFYVRTDSSCGAYLKRKQDSLAAALAQKDYDLSLVRELRTEIRALERTIDLCRPERIDDLFGSLNEYRKTMVRPVRLQDEDYIKKWKSAEYEKKPFDENDPDFYTTNGERVRSKSEILIADALSRHSIPYRYEYPIQIPGIGTVHPDFMCLNMRNRKVYLWEHNGKMSDPDYSDYAIKKIEKYALVGYNTGKNLILTFESSFCPLSSRVIEQSINSHLL